MPKQPANHHAKLKATRALIHEADPVAFAINAMMGLPAPKRDMAGRIIGEEPALDHEKRVNIALALARKIMPDLAAQQIDLTSGGGEIGFKIILGDGVLPPASVDDAQVIEHEASRQIEGDAGVSAPQIADQEGVSFPPDEDLVRDPEPVSNPARTPAEPQRSKAAAPVRETPDLPPGSPPNARRRVRRRTT